MKTKELTMEQALSVLEHLAMNESLFEDNGSSRAVYHILHDNKEYVVKLAGDKQGRKQNEIERELFNNVGSQGFLAPIVWAYQDIMLICHYVEVLDFDLVEEAYCSSPDDFVDWARQYYYCDEFESREKILSLYDDICKVVRSLEDYQGETSDNYQIGYNSHDFGTGVNQIVAYDYGYTTAIPRNEQVGSVEGYLSFGQSPSSIFDIVSDWILGTETKFQIVFERLDEEGECIEFYDLRGDAMHEFYFHTQGPRSVYKYFIVNKIEMQIDGSEEITEIIRYEGEE